MQMRRDFGVPIMNSDHTQGSRPGDHPREPPVDWDRLKKIQDELPPWRVPGGAVLAVFLLGFCGLCFLLAFEAALDPEETIEPARFFVIVAVALGALAGWVAVMLVLRPPPRA